MGDHLNPPQERVGSYLSSTSPRPLRPYDPFPLMMDAPTLMAMDQKRQLATYCVHIARRWMFRWSWVVDVAVTGDEPQQEECLNLCS